MRGKWLRLDLAWALSLSQAGTRAALGAAPSAFTTSSLRPESERLVESRVQVVSPPQINCRDTLFHRLILKVLIRENTQGLPCARLKTNKQIKPLPRNGSVPPRW